MLSEICLLCFSSNSKLNNINQKHIEMLSLLLEDPTFELDSLSPGNSPPRLCYECERRLNNVLLFKTLVAERVTVFKMYLCNENQELPTYKPSLKIEDTTYNNLFKVQHDDDELKDYDDREMSPDRLEENIIDIKCEIKEVPVDIEEPKYYVEVAPKEMQTELTIDKPAQSTIDEPVHNTIDKLEHIDIPSCHSIKEESIKHQEVILPKKERKRSIKREIPKHNVETYMTIWANDDAARTYYESEKHKYTNTEMEGEKDDPRKPRKKYITRCKFCKKDGFDSLTEVYEHYKLHYIHYGCKMCNYKSWCLDDIKLHCAEYQHSKTDVIDDTKYIMCRNCGMAFHKESHVKRHRIQCYGHSYPCEHCGRSFINRSALYSHIQLKHKQLDSVTCDICNKKCKHIFALRAHNHLTDQRNAEVFYCAPCDIQFKTKSGLTNHLRTSLKHFDKDEIHNVQCPHCPSKFLNQTSVRKHVNTVHLGIRKRKERISNRDFVCEICGTKFKTQQVLRGHMRCHSSDRPFKCDQCPATFKFQAALYTHNRLVHKVKKKNRKKEDFDNNK